MVKSELVQKLCNIHPKILRKDIENIFHIIFSEIEKFISASTEHLESIDEVGPIVAETITTFWSDCNNVNAVESCLSSGVQFEPVTGQKSKILEGKTIVFTGALTQFSRNEAKEMAEAHGGRASGAGSKKTDYLVAAPGAGSKLEKAEDLGIPIMDEKEFLVMINEED